jgi:hypothetical protein
VRKMGLPHGLPNCLDGTGSWLCSYPGCGRWSMPGKKKYEGKCPFHYALEKFGETFARQCYPHYTPKPLKSSVG